MAQATYKNGDYVVYPTHGVGQVKGIEKQQVAGTSVDLIVIHFTHDRMVLRLPMHRLESSGLRPVCTEDKMNLALKKLKGRSRVKKTMWSRRAQEYEMKINSGDPAAIAEVVRDLYKNSQQPDQSYSERQIYRTALDRLARELAAVENIDEDLAAMKLEEMMNAA